MYVYMYSSYADHIPMVSILYTYLLLILIGTYAGPVIIITSYIQYAVNWWYIVYTHT